MVEESVELEKQNEFTGQTRRGRKSYPVLPFEEALTLSKSIVQYGAGDSMRRLTLFDKMGRSPESGPSRVLIATSNKYGLTEGGKQAEYIAITESAKSLLCNGHLQKAKKQKEFQMAIEQIDLFNELYEKLKNKRIPDADVLKDEVAQLGVPSEDSQPCGEVFIKNARYLGMIREVAGTERLISIEQVLEELPDDDASQVAPVTAPESTPAVTPATPVTAPVALSTQNSIQNAPITSTKEPTVHIDIQIHIDSSASPAQIDQIFASMAKHLYRRES